METLLPATPRPPEGAVASVLDLVEQKGGEPLIVGGAPRDMLLRGNWPRDMDIEVRLPEEDLLALADEFRKFGKVESFPYGILRLETGDNSLDLAPPREEIYRGPGPFGHRDFEAKIDHTLSPGESVVRRDLTINAIAWDRARGQWVDPLGGREDLSGGIARPCSENFFFDPVRFVRLLRFLFAYGLAMTPELENNLHRFNLTKLSHYHILRDALRVAFFPWIRSFFELTGCHNIPLPPGLVGLDFLGEIPSVEIHPDKGSLLKEARARGVGGEELEKFRQFLGLSKKSLKL